MVHICGMKPSRLERINIAIIGILIQASKYEEAMIHKLGLLADIELREHGDEQLNWVVGRIVRSTQLSATNIKDRLPESKKIHPQQVTRLVSRMDRVGAFSGCLVTNKTQSRKEFVLVPNITESQLFVE